MRRPPAHEIQRCSRKRERFEVWEASLVGLAVSQIEKADPGRGQQGLQNRRLRAGDHEQCIERAARARAKRRFLRR